MQVDFSTLCKPWYAFEQQKKIDPHFSDKCAYKSPIARFEPTLKGWNFAKTFCAGMAGQTINWKAEDFV